MAILESNISSRGLIPVYMAGPIHVDALNVHEITLLAADGIDDQFSLRR